MVLDVGTMEVEEHGGGGENFDLCKIGDSLLVA